MIENGKRKCPKCHRNLVKVRVRGTSLPFLGRAVKGTFKYFKCRVCQYREKDMKNETFVITAPGGKLV